MDYKIEIRRKEELETNIWSGGTTTQLMIYPSTANYSDRNFLWRISSACVEAEESTFTSLPGISRILMVLKGSLRLKHLNQHTASLEEYDQDSFLGDYFTKSYGSATDFNLMMKDGCLGSLEAIKLHPSETFNISLTAQNTFKHATYIYYCVEGNCEISINSQSPVDLKKGDFLSITLNNRTSSLTLDIKPDDSSILNIVKTVVFYN